jgi:Fe-S-cluster containining protein
MIMGRTWEEIFTEVCDRCGGRCCCEARPPLTKERIDLISGSGVPVDRIDFSGYKKIRTREDGFCMMYQKNRCSIHRIKPETCVAGPFTFDIRNGVLEIYLKKEILCPIVPYLKKDEQAYRRQYAMAIDNITKLVRCLPPDEILEILKIEEPETEKVAEIPLDGMKFDDGRN